MLVNQVSDIFIGIETDSSICGGIEFECLDLIVLGEANFDFLAGIGAIHFIQARSGDRLRGEDLLGLRYDSERRRVRTLGVERKCRSAFVHLLNHYNL